MQLQTHGGQVHVVHLLTDMLVGAKLELERAG